MRCARQLLLLVLLLGAAVTACADRDPAGSKEAKGSTTTTLPAANALDSCVVIDAAAVGLISGLEVAKGAIGEPYGTDSLCNFVSLDGQVTVAVQLGQQGGGPDGADAAFLTKQGFEGAYGPSTSIPRLAHKGYGSLVVDRPTHLAAALSTDGKEYAMVTFVGANVEAADVDVAADVLREVEKRRLRLRYGADVDTGDDAGD